MIELIKLQAGNMGSFETLDVDLANRGVVLLTGKNGVGKSTVVDLVQIGLYGRSARYASYKDLLKKGTKEGFINIDFSANGVLHRIIRKIEPHKQTLRLTVWKKGWSDEGVDITGIHLEATQEKLDRILKTSWNVFSNIVTVSGEPVLFSETDGYQKSFMERMLGFEEYSEAQDLTKSYRRAVEEELTASKLDLAIKTNKQQTIKTQIDTLGQKDIAVKKSKLEDAKLQSQGLDADIEGVEGEIKNLDTMIVKAKKDMEPLERSHGESYKQVEALGAENNKIAVKLSGLQQELKSAKEVADAKRCPTCLQNVSVEKQSQATERVARLTIEIKRLEDDHSKIEDMKKGFLDQYMQESTLKTQIERDLSRLEATKASLRAEKASLVMRKGKVQTRMVEIEKEAGAEVRPLRKELEELEIAIGMVAKVIDEDKKTIEVMDFCVEAFGDKGIKSLLIEQYLLKISESMNENLEFLTDGKMSAFLAPTKKLKSSNEFKDKMTLRVVDREESEELLEYQHCSEGQRACVNLAALLAFHDIIAEEKHVSWGILFLDEVMEALDPERAANVSKLLARKVSIFPSIILTTHKPDFKEAFDNVWEVTKKKGAAHLEE